MRISVVLLCLFLMGSCGIRAQETRNPPVLPGKTLLELPYEPGKAPPPLEPGYAWYLVATVPQFVFAKDPDLAEEVEIPPAAEILEPFAGPMRVQTEKILLTPEHRTITGVQEETYRTVQKRVLLREEVDEPLWEYVSKEKTVRILVAPEKKVPKIIPTQYKTTKVTVVTAPAQEKISNLLSTSGPQELEGGECLLAGYTVTMVPAAWCGGR